MGGHPSLEADPLVNKSVLILLPLEKVRHLREFAVGAEWAATDAAKM